MKYIKYLFSVFLVLATVLLGVSSVKAQEIPTGVNSIERKAIYWEHVSTTGGQVLVKSNRFFIDEDIYKYFLFDLKFFAGSTKGGALGSSQGIYFYNTSNTTTFSDKINFNQFDFDNFIDMTDYTDRWIEFRLVFDLQGTDTEEKILTNINNNPNYELSILAISGSGIIVESDLYDYLTDYVDTIISGRIDYAYQRGYDNGKIDYGYDYNGTIIPGQNAYDNGYAKGTQESGDLKAQIINFVPGVLGSIFMFFFQLGQIGILGITILDILGIVVLISGLIFLIKFFF